MPSNYYIGTSPDESLGDSPRYFYGVRRNHDGELYFVRSDLLRDTDAIVLNNPGTPGETFEEFEAGVDYLDGIDTNHNNINENLKYPQYRWDNRNMVYYIDEQGHLVVRINRSYAYPSGISS